MQLNGKNNSHFIGNNRRGIVNPPAVAFEFTARGRGGPDFLPEIGLVFNFCLYLCVMISPEVAL
jgi:hypothetical protein